MKNDVRFEYIPWKSAWFCFISIVWVHFILKTEKFDFESLWNTLILFDKNIVSDLNMSQGKEPDFVSFPLLGFTLFLKLKNFDFGSYWKTLTCFDKKNDVRFYYVLSNSVWFGLSFVVWVEFGNKLKNMNFEFYYNSLMFFNLGIYWQIKVCPGFSFFLFVLFVITIEIFLK